MTHYDRRAGRGENPGRFFSKKTFDNTKYSGFEGKNGDRPFSRSDRSDRKPSDRSDRKPFDRSDRKPFDRSDRKPFDRSDRKPSDRSDRKPFDRSDRKPFDRSDRKPFDRSDRKPFDRSDRKPFDRSDRKPSDRSDRKPFDRSDRKPSDRSERNTDGRERRFSDRNSDRPFRKFPDREKRFDRDRKFDERPGHAFRKGDDGPGFSKGRTFHPRKKSAAGEPEDDGLVRLNRYISNSGVCSRRKADELIEAGEISVNGTVVTELGTKVDPAKDEIRHNGKRLKREKMVYVLLNKPKDFITTTDDPDDRKTVMQLVAKATKDRVYPVGRLDRNTTGLLLLTNDGSLADELTHPRNNIGKMYHVELDKSLTQGDFNKLRFGVQLEDGFIKPDDISYVLGGSKRDIGIQIHSGKNRIVRRIFESLGYEVVRLDRVVYAGLTKKDLPRGRWRYLEEREIGQLKQLRIP